MQSNGNITISSNGQAIFHAQPTFTLPEPATHGAMNLIHVLDYVYECIADMILDEIAEQYDSDGIYSLDSEYVDTDTGIIYPFTFKGNFSFTEYHRAATYLDPPENERSVYSVSILEWRIWSQVDLDDVPNDDSHKSTSEIENLFINRSI